MPSGSRRLLALPALAGGLPRPECAQRRLPVAGAGIPFSALRRVRRVVLLPVQRPAQHDFHPIGPEAFPVVEGVGLRVRHVHRELDEAAALFPCPRDGALQECPADPAPAVVWMDDEAADEGKGAVRCLVRPSGQLPRARRHTYTHEVCMPASNGPSAGPPGLLACIRDADPAFIAALLPAPREARGAVTSR